MNYSVSTDEFVTMRDGVALAMNIYRPDSAEPVPALLLRTPYGREQSRLPIIADISQLVENGYAVVLQDCRGRFGSGGGFVPHESDGSDGADTVAWLADQEWCDGNVGMFGYSYMGFAQWQAAASGVTGLKAIAPAIASADFYRAPWYSPGGALSLSIVRTWSTMVSLAEVSRALVQGSGDPSDLAHLLNDLKDSRPKQAATPVADLPHVAKYLPWTVDTVLSHPDRDKIWENLAPLDHAESITTPALNIGGWYDLFCGETLHAYTEMKNRGGSAAARTGQRLIIGPWSHSGTGIFGYYPGRDFGPTAGAAAAMLTDDYVAFFDRWLRGRTDALDGRAPVRLFVMGVDEWREEQDWPLPDTTYIEYYLDGDGPANTAAGAGRLATATPASPATDTYLYDPRRPVPSLGGLTALSGEVDGPADQRPVHNRDDVLVFTTDVLDEPLEVTGPVSATLCVSSSAVDTDFTAKLVDIHPDGRAIILCEGIQRMRYRESLSEPRLMTPGEVYRVKIDMIATSNVFLPGHRVAIEISSSSFPRYDRNPNTGGIVAHALESDMVVAVNHVHRGALRPSSVTLPVIKR